MKTTLLQVFRNFCHGSSYLSITLALVLLFSKGLRILALMEQIVSHDRFSRLIAVAVITLPNWVGPHSTLSSLVPTSHDCPPHPLPQRHLPPSRAFLIPLP